MPFRTGDRIVVTMELPAHAGLAATPSARDYTMVRAGDHGVVHEVGTDGRVWVRLDKPLAAAGALWPFTADQIRPA